MKIIFKTTFFYILLSIIFLNFSINNTYSDDNGPKTFIKKTGYELYKHNVDNFCKEYKNTDNSSELIYTFNETSYFKEIKENNSKGLDIAVKDYRKNMDSIYLCATSISFKRQLDLIQKKLITKNAKLNSKMKSRIENKKKQTENKVKKLKGNCKINTDSKNNLIKKSVLKQTTYELCKYNFYLQYLKEYNNNHIQNLGDIKDGTSIAEITRLNKNKQGQIETEIQKSYRAFPLVFQAYSDFENNIGTHILLELLKEDYALFRDELHKTINPINQVVYKISNAMRK